MLQAEVGSGRITEENKLPTMGRLMRNFTLPSIDGKRISLYDYRGRSNVVLIFGGEAEGTTRELLSALLGHYTEIREQDAEVVLVVAPYRTGVSKYQARLPFPVLVDQDMEVHKSVGALGTHAAVFVTDRFLELFAVWRSVGIHAPSPLEILTSLDYINSQCPECTQVEWPAED